MAGTGGGGGGGRAARLAEKGGAQLGRQCGWGGEERADGHLP